MESNSVNRDCLNPGTSVKVEEGKIVDNGSGKSCATEGVPPCPEHLEHAHLKPGKGAPPRTKLCGYLNKCSSKAPIKVWKSRWFSYDENKCQLLYYRTAQDVNPLGNIEIATASFDLQLGAEEGVFEIRTLTKDFILKVCAIPGCLLVMGGVVQLRLLLMAWVTR